MKEENDNRFTKIIYIIIFIILMILVLIILYILLILFRPDIASFIYLLVMMNI